VTSGEDDALNLVRDRLKHYVDRGVLGGMSERRDRRAGALFSFRWLLGREFSLAVDPKRRRLTAKNLLPGVEYRSFMDSDLRRFIAHRSEEALPSHRRIDPDRATLSYTNRKQQVSLVLQVEADQYEYAVKVLLGTINDLFAHLHLNHIDYLHRQFGLPEE
jgi:hypothetical protein